MQNKQLNNGIQSLRGIAAIVVFLSHGLNVMQSDTIDWLLKSPFHFFFDGQIAVVVFMVLSSYFYYRVDFSIMNYAKGILRKVKRIYPAHIIVLATAFVLCNCGFFNEVKDASEWGVAILDYRCSICRIFETTNIVNTI